METAPYNPKTFSLKKSLEAYYKAKPEKVIDHISPSQLGGCMRAHYYKIKHIETTMKPTIGALSNFEVGFMWEQIIHGVLRDQGIPFVFQHEMYDPELNMGGTLDFLIGTNILPVTNETPLRILDTKTQRSEWFWYREMQKKKHMFDRWESDYGYIIQQGCYLLMLERKGFKAVSDSILGYISKDDGFVGDEYSVILNPKLRNEIMHRIDDLNAYLANNQVPPCTCEGWHVGYCDYGNPHTTQKNKKGKMLATECCGTLEDLAIWGQPMTA